MYLTIKSLHILCAVISITGFSLRGLLKLYKPTLLNQRWIRIVPHCVDATLLGSALYLAYASQQYPFIQPWLTAKILALLLYIFLGLIVMRFAASNQQRIIALLLALATFAYIVSVALSRQVLPWL
jgi:uncharacterized membrane protein SirB2